MLLALHSFLDLGVWLSTGVLMRGDRPDLRRLLEDILILGVI